MYPWTSLKTRLIFTQSACIFIRLNAVVLHVRDCMAAIYLNNQIRRMPSNAEYDLDKTLSHLDSLRYLLPMSYETRQRHTTIGLHSP